MNQRFPTSSFWPPYRLTIRLRFLAQVSCVVQASPCQFRRRSVWRATSAPVFSVAPTFCTMLE